VRDPKTDAASRHHVGVRELRANLTAYLRQAGQGEIIAITSHDTVIAELHPPPSPSAVLPPRKPGGMKGQIWMADDFDEMPPELLAAMEGDED
jgi:antitoxin (DNA-binding transcriptional repressor) of toxin-antitoxin stability system